MCSGNRTQLATGATAYLAAPPGTVTPIAAQLSQRLPRPAR
ncbi:hypothetical protein SBADM41S_00623 [Streptomyces badius]